MAGNIAFPNVEVEAVVLTVVGPHELVRGAVVVIIELDEEIVELGIVDGITHVDFREGTLWRAGNVVSVAAIRREVAAELVHEVLVILVAVRVGLDVEIPTIDKDVAKRAWASLGDCWIGI